MKKKLAIGISVLIVFGIYALAQDSPAQSAAGGSSNQSSVQGCLSRSDNGYRLTDKAGSIYQLAGDTTKLGNHVGHEVEIRGTVAASGQTAGAPSSATKEASPARIDVLSVKHISSTCTSTPDAGDYKSPMEKKPPRSEEPPMSEKPPGPPPGEA